MKTPNSCNLRLLVSERVLKLGSGLRLWGQHAQTAKTKLTRILEETGPEDDMIHAACTLSTLDVSLCIVPEILNPKP